MRKKHNQKFITRAQLNKDTYLKPPSHEMIINFISELGVSQSQFERFLGIPTGTIRQITYGTHNLPARFWHFIYEKQMPVYGVGIYYEKPVSKSVTKSVTKSVVNTAISTPLLEKLKSQLSDSTG